MSDVNQFSSNVLLSIVNRLDRPNDKSIDEKERSDRQKVLGLLLQSVKEGMEHAIDGIRDLFQEASGDRSLDPRFVADTLFSFVLMYPDSRHWVPSILDSCIDPEACYLFGDGIVIGLLEILSMPDCAQNESSSSCAKNFFLKIASSDSALWKYLISSQMTKKSKGMLSNAVNEFFDAATTGNSPSTYHLTLFHDAMKSWKSRVHLLTSLPDGSVLVFLIDQMLSRYLLRLSLEERLNLAIKWC